MKHFALLFFTLCLSNSYTYSSTSILGNIETEPACNTSFVITSSTQPQTSPDTVLNDSIGYEKIGYEKKGTSPVNHTPHFLERSFNSIRVTIVQEYLEQSSSCKSRNQTPDFGTPWEDDNDVQTPVASAKSTMQPLRKTTTTKPMSFAEKFKEEIERQKKS